MEYNLVETLEYVTFKHAGQFRKSEIGGTFLPYIVHPISVMQLVWKWGAGREYLLKAAVSHDVPEDCGVPRDELTLRLGKRSADIVWEVSFFPTGVAGEKEQYMTSFGSKSIEAIIVKLADRFCNCLDFKLTDPKYALKYWDKAKPLFDVYFAREEEIAKEFGEQVRRQISLSYYGVENKLRNALILTPM